MVAAVHIGGPGGAGTPRGLAPRSVPRCIAIGSRLRRVGVGPAVLDTPSRNEAGHAPKRSRASNATQSARDDPPHRDRRRLARDPEPRLRHGKATRPCVRRGSTAARRPRLERDDRPRVGRADPAAGGAHAHRRSPAGRRTGSSDHSTGDTNERRTEMGKIVISENVSLDGVVQDPTGDEGFRQGGRFGQIGDKDREEWAKVEFAEALGTEALLLGRRSYEWFAARWPSRSGEWADRLNSLPKYVVSSTLVHPEWNNSTVLEGEVVNQVSKLKQELDGEIVVYASRQLVRTLMEHDLVDEMRLMVYPVALGAGERLFGETSDKKSMRLLDTRTVGDRLAYLTYELVREA